MTAGTTTLQSSAARPNTAMLDQRSLLLRRLIMDALLNGGRGHVGPALSLVEIFRVLYDDILKVRPEDPKWPDRDRCILSKGHGCLALYAILADRGFFPSAEMATFCREGSRLGGHPEYGKVPGVEASTGALGHGLSIGIGLALAARMQSRPSRVFVVMGDGELNEGSVWEAAMAASKHKLGHLVAIVDSNKFQASGPTANVLDLEPLGDKFRSFGFDVVEVDGHDVRALRAAFGGLNYSQARPHLMICHTVKGKGIEAAEHNSDWHHKSRFSGADLEMIRQSLGMADA
jgi:transketolase